MTVYKLFLTKAEIRILSVAMEQHQLILTKAFEQKDQLFTHEDDEQLFSDDQEHTEIIREKIKQLLSYVKLSNKAQTARNKANKQRRIYLNYALRGISPEPDPDQPEIIRQESAEESDPFRDLTADLEIPDP